MIVETRMQKNTTKPPYLFLRYFLLFRMAFEILHLMSEILVKANSWSYNSLINACEAASQWQMALFQLHDMKKHTLESWN